LLDSPFSPSWIETYVPYHPDEAVIHDHHEEMNFGSAISAPGRYQFLVDEMWRWLLVEVVTIETVSYHDRQLDWDESMNRYHGFLSDVAPVAAMRCWYRF
jgi:hypothetical protein